MCYDCTHSPCDAALRNLVSNGIVVAVGVARLFAQRGRARVFFFSPFRRRRRRLVCLLCFIVSTNWPIIAAIFSLVYKFSCVIIRAFGAHSRRYRLGSNCAILCASREALRIIDEKTKCARKPPRAHSLCCVLAT